MSCWDTRGNAICQSCTTLGPAMADRNKTVEFLRSQGWRCSKGVTYGMTAYEVVLCPGCVHEQTKRAIRQPAIQQDALPIDWEQLEAEARSDGQQWRHQDR